jgi:hypothetical protein
MDRGTVIRIDTVPMNRSHNRRALVIVREQTAAIAITPERL